MKQEARQWFFWKETGKMQRLLVGLLFLLCLAQGCKSKQQKLAQDKASRRALAVALEDYTVDWQGYPSDLNALTSHVVYDPPVSWLGGRMVSEIGPYIGSIPHSAFDPNLGPRYYAGPAGPVLNTWFAWLPG